MTPLSSFKFILIKVFLIAACVHFSAGSRVSEQSGVANSAERGVSYRFEECIEKALSCEDDPYTMNSEVYFRKKCREQEFPVLLVIARQDAQEESFILSYKFLGASMFFSLALMIKIHY